MDQTSVSEAATQILTCYYHSIGQFFSVLKDFCALMCSDFMTTLKFYISYEKTHTENVPQKSARQRLSRMCSIQCEIELKFCLRAQCLQHYGNITMVKLSCLGGGVKLTMCRGGYAGAWMWGLSEVVSEAGWSVRYRQRAGREGGRRNSVQKAVFPITRDFIMSGWGSEIEHVSGRLCQYRRINKARADDVTGIECTGKMGKLPWVQGWWSEEADEARGWRTETDWESLVDENDGMRMRIQYHVRGSSEFCINDTWSQQWTLVGIYDHTCFYACNSPDQTSGHTKESCQPGDCRWPFDLPYVLCGYVWVIIHVRGWSWWCKGWGTDYTDEVMTDEVHGTPTLGKKVIRVMHNECIGFEEGCTHARMMQQIEFFLLLQWHSHCNILCTTMCHIAFLWSNLEWRVINMAMSLQPSMALHPTLQ